MKVATAPITYIHYTYDSRNTFVKLTAIVWGVGVIPSRTYDLDFALFATASSWLYHINYD